MIDYPTYFKGKKMTLMGLGLLGRGVGDAAFLAEQGAELIVTDLKSAEELAPSLEKLQGYKNIRYTLGGHKLEDFRDRELVIKGPKVPLNSPHIAEARKNKIPITMSTALFAKLADIPIIGVTGTRGKTTIAAMVHAILKAAGRKAILAGNIPSVSTLALLPQAASAEVAVLELDSWQLQGFAEEKISPNIAIFSTFYDDHLDYYGDRDSYLADKAPIFLFQEDDDTLIIGSQAADLIKEKYGKKICSHVIIPKRLPKSWKLKIPGEHNRENAALAATAARAFGVDDDIIRTALEQFPGVPGRLELIAKKNDVKVYNDTNSTTPEATIVGLQALDPEGKKNIILIMGGYDKGLSTDALLPEIARHAKSVLLLSGSGTDRIKKLLPDSTIYRTISEAVVVAFKEAQVGDNVLLSPAFASFGMFKNEYDRGAQFLKAVEQLA